MTILIAGGGIAGLAMALTCHEIGAPAKVFESARDLRPLGVGINLQPNAVRELYDLGFEGSLPDIGIRTKEWALVGRNGNDVWSEPRGLNAGYDWPQYSVHRGQLQMMLYRAVIERLGPDSVVTGHRLTGYENTSSGVSARFRTTSDDTLDVSGQLLIGADGLHSATRRQMYPSEGDPIWAGAVMWRGTTLGLPIRSGASFTLVGRLDQRFVHYPITEPDPETGLQVQNWIAELTYDHADGRQTGDWNRSADVDDFLPAFEDWDFDWLDVPALIRGASAVYEYPMVDRDPPPSWVDGNVALMGDAAHVMYPVGSNGASQAIVDARVLGACVLEHGLRREALLSYEHLLLDDISSLVLRNRGAGPIAILGVVEERCGGVFDDIEDIIPASEIESSMARYREAAGLAADQLNSAPPTIRPGSTLNS